MMRTSGRALREMEDALMAKLRSCASFDDLRRVHARVILLSLSQSSYLATQLVHVCSAVGRVHHAAEVFGRVHEPNAFLRNAMIKAYAQNHRFLDAIAVFLQMLNCERNRKDAQNGASADRFTYPFVLKACGGLSNLGLGKQVHGQVIKRGLDSNSFVQNSLIEMYTRCDDLAFARNLFDGMQERDVVSWNTLVSAHARLGQMRKARTLFNAMPNKTVVSWTALISGYTSVGSHADAVEVFRAMQMEGFEPDDVSIVTVLPACAQLGALELGRWIHAYCDKHALLEKTFVRNALMEMYAKCGCIDQAVQLFYDMADRDVISWSTVIAALAAHGRAHEAIALFAEMERDRRVRPNGITFVGLLSACSHAGLLEAGLRYFHRMKDVYGIDPCVEHYGCIVDLLGRSGQLRRALELISGMPIPPDAKIWGSLLSACRSRGDTETAALAAERLVELEPDDAGNYVILANVYAAARRWDEVASTRKAMRSKSVTKTPGCSSVELDNVVQEFVAGEDLSPRFRGAVSMLQLLAAQLDGSDESFEPIGDMDLIDSEHELSVEIFC